MPVAIEPNAFDLIVLGTGLQEALLAAAAAQAGLTVLQLDSQAEYGSQWAGLSLDACIRWAERLQGPAAAPAPSPQVASSRPDASSSELGIEEVTVGSRSRIFSNARVERRGAIEEAEMRRLTVDLAPKVLYTNGAMVDALLRCKADSYMTFRLVRNCSYSATGAIRSVPASRSDVFTDASLGPADKRALMRLLKGTIEALDGAGTLKDAFDGRPFRSLLEEQRLPAALQDVVMYSLAMADRAAAAAETSGNSDAQPSSTDAQAEATGLQNGAAVSAREGSHANVQPGPGAQEPLCAADALARLKSYFDSVRRFGGPFMLPDYGPGEIPQAFCRAAAVHGALYVLRCAPHSLLLETGSRRCVGVRTADGQVLDCQALAAHADLLPPEFVECNTNQIVARAIAVVGAGLRVSSEAEAQQTPQMVLTVPPGALGGGLPRNPVRILQLGSQSLISQGERCVLHFSAQGQEASAARDLQAALASPLLRGGGGEPEALLRFDQAAAVVAGRSLPPNIALCEPPDASIGYGRAIEGARQKFERLFPETPFLPELPQMEGADDSD